MFDFPLLSLTLFSAASSFFLSETECKGNAFFWPAKTFQKKFQTIYYLAFDLLQHPVSLESGCKSRHFLFTIQIFWAIFSHIFQTFFLRFWIRIIFKLNFLLNKSEISCALCSVMKNMFYKTLKFLFYKISFSGKMRI